LFSALYGIFVANFVAFDGDEVRRLSAELLALAENRGTTVPLMIGHRIVALSLLLGGDITAALPYYDAALLPDLDAAEYAARRRHRARGLDERHHTLRRHGESAMHLAELRGHEVRSETGTRNLSILYQCRK
jgi:hypothetical protein